MSTTTNAMTPSRQRLPTSPMRRDSASSISSRSTISQRSKRSPSPIVAFTQSPRSSEGKGVKDITRQVMRTLESFGFATVHDDDQASDISEHDESDRTRTPSPVNGQPEQETGALPAVKKIDWEIPRKALHSSIGFGTLYLWHSEASPKTVIVTLWSALCIIAPADFLRFRYPAFERFYERVLGSFMRESEKNKVNGVIWYIIGVNVALTCFPLDVAVVAILILSWADTAASTIGRLWGSKTPRLPRSFMGLPFAPQKSLAGFLAACVTGAAVAAGFWTLNAPMRPIPQDVSWSWSEGVKAVAQSPISDEYTFTTSGALGLAGISLFAGLVSGVTEALDVGSLDDNLTLPIITGGCLTLLLKALSFFAHS